MRVFFSAENLRRVFHQISLVRFSPAPSGPARREICPPDRFLSSLLCLIVSDGDQTRRHGSTSRNADQAFDIARNDYDDRHE
jgi:hypothetical protein